MKLAFAFPGQGSQAVGMLKAYAGLDAVTKARAQAEGALGGEFVRLLDEGPAEGLNLTVNTQPAMLLVGYAAYTAWRALGGRVPDVMAGHSLGEYTALTAAGCINFMDALPLVRFRAKAMQEAVPPGRGAMAAILGLDEESVQKACAEALGDVQAVNFNAPGQIVIAGEAKAVERAALLCKSRGAKRTMPLPVSAPFHSSLMRPAGEALKPYLQKLTLTAPQVPVINNVDVKVETRPDDIRYALVRQAYSPVRWVETVRKMQAEGVTHLYECGPGKVLAGLTKRIAPEMKSLALADRASLEEALKEA
jgi:[acyl-carrier-protein] S-malonyltransferase